MSVRLLTLAKRFVQTRMDPEQFSEEYIQAWKWERDNGLLNVDPPQLSEVLSSIFCWADQFNPAPDREWHELDEPALRTKVAELINGLSN